MFAHVSVGILIATLIITAAGGTLIYLNAKAEKEQILLMTTELARPAREAMEERNRERQATLAIAEANARAALEAQRIRREAAEENYHNQAAFKRWYKKPEECDQPERHSIRVECGNKYMRARAEWEQMTGKRLLN